MRNSNQKLLGMLLPLFTSALTVGSILGATSVAAQEVFIQGGTQGGGVGAALPLGRWAGVHADIDGFNVSHSFHAGGNKFDGNLHVRHLGLYGDFFPIPNTGFRLTAGALFNRDRLNGVAVPEDGNYKINGTSIPAGLFQGQQATVQARFPTVMPYAGIGWGHKPVSKGFGIVADLGVAYGRPRVDFSIPGRLVQLAGPAVAEEEASIRHSIEKFRWYPVLQIGVSYRF